MNAIIQLSQFLSLRLFYIFHLCMRKIHVCILRATVSQANPRFIFSNQGNIFNKKFPLETENGFIKQVVNITGIWSITVPAIEIQVEHGCVMSNRIWASPTINKQIFWIFHFCKSTAMKWPEVDFINILCTTFELNI